MDDTILFSRATVEEAAELKRVLQDYEGASRQKINLDKTEVTVNVHLTAERCREISIRLGVKEVE